MPPTARGHVSCTEKTYISVQNARRQGQQGALPGFFFLNLLGGDPKMLALLQRARFAKQHLGY
jgi:hypothetical protein